MCHLFNLKVMEDRKINESESLELISEMIRRTKNGPSAKKDYNAFLFYGYTAVAVSILAWSLIRFTGKMEFMFVWFAMFLPYFVTLFKDKRKKDTEVVTYLQGMLDNVWKVIGSMFGLTVAAMVIIGAITGNIDFSLMMPLSIIYAGIGTIMTGLVLKEKWFELPPFCGLLIAVYMLMEGHVNNDWNLWFGLAFLIIMVMPAHVVRSKIKF